MKHTPGPWIYLYTQVDDNRGRYICDVYLTDEGDYSRKANGKLIEVALNMLAVCQKLVEADKYAVDGALYTEYIELVAEAREMAREILERLK